MICQITHVSTPTAIAPIATNAVLFIISALNACPDGDLTLQSPSDAYDCEGNYIKSRFQSCKFLQTSL